MVDYSSKNRTVKVNGYVKTTGLLKQSSFKKLLLRHGRSRIVVTLWDISVSRMSTSALIYPDGMRELSVYANVPAQTPLSFTTLFRLCH